MTVAAETAVETEARPRRWANRRGHSAGIILVVAAVLATSRVLGPKLSLDWWYDEMWRVDLMRRDEWRAAFVAEATPLPPVWFFLGRAVLRPVYLGAATVRGLAGVLVATAPLAAGALASVILRREPADRIGPAVAGGGVAFAVMAGPFSAEIFSYLNNYAFEAGVTIAAVAAVAAAPRDRPLTGSVMATIIALPASTIGGLVLLPGIGVALAWRAVRLEGVARQTAVRRLAVTAVSSGAVALGTYLFMYRAALGRDSTADFFVQERFSGGITDVPLATWRLAEGIVHANAWYPTWLTVMLTAIGAVVVSRRQPWLVPTLAAGMVGVIAASATTGFPAAANRVHAPLILLLSSLTAIGAIAPVLAIRSRAQWSAALASAGSALAIAALIHWAPQDDEPPWKGLRGITQDIEPIITTPYDRNIVVSYHWMTRWTVHDRLVNGPSPPNVSYRLLGERRLGTENSPRLDQPVYERLPKLVAASPDWAVWCVLPYDMGPEAFGRACGLEGSGRRRLVARHGPRAEVVLWTPVGG